MEFRGTYYSDIAFREVFPRVGVALALYAIIYVVALVIMMAGGLIGRASTERHNAKAEVFNALSFTERKAIASYTEDDSIDLSDYSMAIKPPVSLKDLPICIAVVLFLPMTLLTFSLVTAISYGKEKKKTCYWADLPLHRPYGWFLLISLFIIWPALLVSAIRLYHAKHLANRAETKEINRIAQLAVDEEFDEKIHPRVKFTKKARSLYMTTRIKGNKNVHENKLNAVRIRIDCCRDRLYKLGDDMRKEQRALGEYTAQLKELESVTFTDKILRQTAKAEWQAITEMRGVATINMSSDSFLSILVKVRVPYQSEIYDFGDFIIRIKPGSYSCKEVRSGVKLNHTSTRPAYRNGGSNFCFGGREGQISSYVHNACLLEAITLMIDCLHFVNEDDEKYIPACFRAISLVELAKLQFHARRNK